MVTKRVACALCAAVMALACSFALAGEEFSVAQIDRKQQPIPDNEALSFTRSMKAGWNLGNTFDAVDCGVIDGLLYETAWVGVKTTPQLFDALKESGFGSVRIPVSWHNHVSGEEFTIDAAWLARVKEVVGYALGSGLIVILNMHHDVDPAYLFPDEVHLDQSVRYLTSVWQQVAEAFTEVGDSLVFESMNEPRLKGTTIEWWLNPGDSRGGEAVRCINALNQAFVDTVRAAGGENAARYLMVPGYDASADGALHKEFILPVDSTENRLIVSVHAYTPYAFALQPQTEAGSTAAFDPDNRNDRSQIDRLMQSLYERFVQKGVPVVIGEFGARDKGGNLQSRADYAAYYTAAASACGIPCFIWDNHCFTGDGERFGLLDRGTIAFVYPEIVESLMTYAPEP